jgi:hypothetical protein
MPWPTIDELTPYFIYNCPTKYYTECRGRSWYHDEKKPDEFSIRLKLGLEICGAPKNKDEDKDKDKDKDKDINNNWVNNWLIIGLISHGLISHGLVSHVNGSDKETLYNRGGNKKLWVLYYIII